MQDRYVGDIGDYGKLLLLRHLNRCAVGRLGVVWHTVDGRDENNNDGSIRSYRNYSGVHCLKHCDPVLFEGFGRFDSPANRKIEHLQPFVEASFFNEQVPTVDRRIWTKRALNATEQAEVVFFDPDNGIAAEPSGNSPKHVYLDELRAFWRRGQSLIVYHHLSRKKGGHEVESKDVEARLRNSLPEATTRIVHLRRGTSRILILVMQNKHLRQLDSVLCNRPPWYPLTQTKGDWARKARQQHSQVTARRRYQ